jgi:CRP-like cAMP-binding protein
MIFRDFLRGREQARLGDLDRAALDDLISDTRDVPARHILIPAGEPVRTSTYLIDGFICRYMDDHEGLRQLVALHVPGDFVDLHAYPLGKLDHDVATLSPCRVALVPHGRLDGIVSERPALTRSLWFSTLLDAAMHREWVFRLGRLGASARLAHFFAETEIRLRAVGRSDGRRFDLPLTQADMAEACGITPVHVNRMLRALRDRGIMNVRGGTVELFDREALWRMAEFDPAYLFIDTDVPALRMEAGA